MTGIMLFWATTILIPVYATTTVTGSDNPAVDLPAVQTAVDSDTDVILQGTFDFGTGTVTITTDVTITGDGAVIRNGNPAFTVDNPMGTVEVTNIDFDGPQLSSLLCKFGSPLASCTFSDNTVNIDTTGIVIHPVYGTLAMALGVYVESLEAELQSNTIDISNPGGTAPAAMWLDQGGLTPGISTISGNEVTVYNTDGIKANNVENVHITDNTVNVDSDKTSGWLEAILVRGSNSMVTDNTIMSTAHVPGRLVGVAIANGIGNLVSNNNVAGTIEQGFRVATTSQNVFEDNTFSGKQVTGIHLQGPSPDNMFTGNDFSAVHASKAQVHINAVSSGNVFEENNFGGISGQADAGILCEGFDNSFVENKYKVNYPDWADGKGLWWFTDTSQNNDVIEPTVKGGLKVWKHWKDEGTGNTLTP
jgi:hypothetical protein